MKQGDVICENGMRLLVVSSYDHKEPCMGCFFYKDGKCGSKKLIKCYRSPEEKHEEEMRFCKDLNDLRCEMLIDMAKKIEEYLS